MQLAIPPVVAGARLFLAAVSPFQGIIDRPGRTHEFCNKQAITILRNDGYNICADFLVSYLKELNAGVYWADQGWKNVSHYFVPASGGGLWRFNNALDECCSYLKEAANSVAREDYAASTFFLGAAAHLVQDLCVPHHARAKVFCGHKEYEIWAEHNCAAYAVQTQGLYDEGAELKMWILKNAQTAADLLDWVNGEANTEDYHKATSILLPMAQRSTAGMFQQFFEVALKECLLKNTSSKVLVA